MFSITFHERFEQLYVLPATLRYPKSYNDQLNRLSDLCCIINFENIYYSKSNDLGNIVFVFSVCSFVGFHLEPSLELLNRKNRGFLFDMHIVY